MCWQVDMKNTVDVLLGDIVRLEQWPSVVLLYDETVFRERALSIKADIQRKTHDIKFHEIKLFLENDRKPFHFPTLIAQLIYRHLKNRPAFNVRDLIKNSLRSLGTANFEKFSKYRVSSCYHHCCTWLQITVYHTI